MATYLALLDSTTSLLVAGHEPSSTAIEDMSHVGEHGLAITDLHRNLSVKIPTRDTRSTERDYGYIAFTTSGTSGNPKVVLYAKATLLACAAQISEILELGHIDRAVSYARPSLAYGLSIAHSHYIANTEVIFRLPKTDPLEFQQEIARLPDPRFVYLLPLHATQLTYGETRKPDQRAITFLIAGAMLPGPVATKLSTRYPNAMIANMYGQSELGPRISTWTGRLSDYREGAVGRPLPGVSLYIESPQRSNGPIWVSSPYRMLRYLRGSAPTADGTDTSRLHWTKTGDLGSLDEMGSLVVAGRGTGSANVAGEVIQVAAIESVVRALDDVALCSVTVEPHTTFGELPIIRILPATLDADEHELIRKVRRQLHERIGRAAALSSITVLAGSYPREKV